MFTNEYTDKQWNNYLKKYNKKYKLYKDQAGMWKIRCRKGEIYLYSLEKQVLAMHFFTISKKKLSNLQIDKELTLKVESSNRAIILFHEKTIASREAIFKIFRKKILSEGQRQASIERLKKYRFSRSSPA